MEQFLCWEVGFTTDVIDASTSTVTPPPPRCLFGATCSCCLSSELSVFKQHALTVIQTRLFRGSWGGVQGRVVPRGFENIHPMRGPEALKPFNLRAKGLVPNALNISHAIGAEDAAQSGRLCWLQEFGSRLATTRPVHSSSEQNCSNVWHTWSRTHQPIKFCDASLYIRAKRSVSFSSTVVEIADRFTITRSELLLSFRLECN